MVKIQSRSNLWLTHCLFMLLGLVSIAHAETLILKGDNFTPLALAPHYQLHTDSQHTLSIDDILSSKNQIEFSSISDNDYQLTFQQETLWYKVDITNTNAYDIKQLLEFNFPLLDDLGIYIVHKQSKRILARFDANNTQSFNNRLYQHSNFIFPITLPAKSNLTFYFRIQSNRFMTLEASLWQPNTFAEQDRLSYFLICLYLGLLISLIAYNLLLFISINSAKYLYYALFSSAMLFAVGAYNGIWFELFWPTRSIWQAASIPVSFAVCGLFTVLFSRTFLQTMFDAPTLDKAFLLMAIAFVLALITTPFIALSISIQIIAICWLISAIIGIITSFTLSIRGSRAGLIYLISWLGFLLGIALFSAQSLGWLPKNAWTHNSVIYGSTLEMFLLLFTLAQRIPRLNKENNLSRQEVFKAHNQLIDRLRINDRELFNIVKKRTTTLAMANEYLLSQQEKNHDTLTGLANASLIIEQLQLLLKQCKRKNTKLAVLLLNVNDFKHVNAKFGHEIGDKLLISLAAKLRDNFRQSDIAARTNGDEFIILLEISNTEKDAEHIVKKIKKTMTETIIIDGYAIQTSVSIGIATYPNDGDDAEDLISKATQAMYVDKGYLTSIKDLTST